MPRLLKRVLLLILFLFCLPLFIAWILIAQPSFSHNSPFPLSVEPARLETHVRKLSQEFHPRNYQHPKNLDACAAYIQKTFADSGAQTSIQSYSLVEGQFQNVIASFGDPSPKKGKWIIGAHYDSCDDTPGADDNASGIAGLLELARLLGKQTNPPSVELVAYTLEEPPFFRSRDMGSARHAKSLIESKALIRGVIILEMIGYFDDQPGTQEYPAGLLKLFYPGRGNFLIVVGQMAQRDFTRDVKIGMKNTSPLPIYSLNAPLSLPGIDLSDHLNYWAQGLPAVMITDTAFYRNQNYHEPTDTWDRLNYPKMAQGVAAVFQSLLWMDAKDK